MGLIRSVPQKRLLVDDLLSCFLKGDIGSGYVVSSVVGLVLGECFHFCVACKGLAAIATNVCVLSFHGVDSFLCVGVVFSSCLYIIIHNVYIQDGIAHKESRLFLVILYTLRITDSEAESPQYADIKGRKSTLGGLSAPGGGTI